MLCDYDGMGFPYGVELVFIYQPGWDKDQQVSSIPTSSKLSLPHHGAPLWIGLHRRNANTSTGPHYPLVNTREDESGTCKDCRIFRIY
jgi:hypothetical protein